MKRLWAPWRLGYIAQARKSSSRGCLFCRLPRSDVGQKKQILVQGRFCYSVLNRFPYNNGHLLIVPRRHVGTLRRLWREEWLEMLALTNDAIHRLEKVVGPHGYNLGINLGPTAGAGIPGHLHLHLVPRWRGDANFMPVVAGTRVISQSLASAHRFLKRAAPIPPLAKPRARRG